MLDDTVFVGIPSDVSGIHFRWDANDAEWTNKATEEVVMRLIERI